MDYNGLTMDLDKPKAIANITYNDESNTALPEDNNKPKIINITNPYTAKILINYPFLLSVE